MRLSLTLSAALLVLCVCAQAQAQVSFQAQQRAASFRYQGGATTSTAATLSRPTVSPYLALTDVGGTGIDQSARYFTQVQPRIQRQQDQQQQQLQIQTMQRDMSAIRSRTARASQNGARITGHPTRFGFYSRYYPSLNRR